ncbi:MAG: polysulfide reductase NrfD [Sulfurovaceae bacterium]
MQETINATQSLVTLDVALPGIIWGGIITINMWAKSIGTGVIIVGAYLLFRHKKEQMPNYRWLIPLIAFIALNVFLLFTLIDLHQPYRMINIFLHPHFTSAITVGAWIASLFTLLVSVMLIIGLASGFPDVLRHKGFAKKLRGSESLYDKLSPIVLFLAFPVTLYTAIIMAESSARELWQAPTELTQMFLAALIAGAATLLLFSTKWSDAVKKDITLVLIFAVTFSFLIYMGEYFFSFKSSEAEATLAYIHLGGAYSIQFWVAMILGYILPFFLGILSVKENTKSVAKVAAISALIGLYLAKDVWLKIPQLLPLS